MRQYPVFLLGVPFDPVTIEDCVRFVGEWVGQKEPARYMATANLDFAMQAAEDVELQEILLQADLVIADGMPLVWASRWFGAPLPERVAGSDLVWRLFERGAKEGWRFYFLGATSETLAEAECALREHYSGIIISGSHAPPFGSIHELDNKAIVSAIREAQPDVLLVAMGCPKQEKWIRMYYEETRVPVSIGIGASLDFVAGKFSRAPLWMQKTGLEWLFRLIQEPKRMFRRYVLDFLFLIVATWKQTSALRQLGPSEAQAIANDVLPDIPTLLVLPPRVDAEAVNGGEVPEVQPKEDAPHCVYDCAHINFIDSTGIGFLGRMHKKCVAEGGTLVLYQPSDALRKVVEAVHLDRVLIMSDTEADLKERLAHSIAPVSFNSARNILHCRIQQDLRAANAEPIYNAIRLRWDCVAALEAIELHLGEVAFMDSSGLSTLIKTYKLAARRVGGATVRLHNANANIRNIITLSRLDSIFTFAD